MPAVVRNLDAGPLGGLNAVEPLAGGELDFVSVDDDDWHDSLSVRSVSLSACDGRHESASVDRQHRQGRHRVGHHVARRDWCA